MNHYKIVIVDDDQDAAEILQMYLQDYFQTVHYFDDGYKFLNHIKSGYSYDLLLLDIKMPTISGTDVYKKLINIQDIPTIFISSVTDPADKVTCLEFGAVDYIVKPFYLREVLARIKNALKNTSSVQDETKPHQHNQCGYQFDGWFLDVNTEVLYTPEKEKISLTKGLFTLLYNFVTNPNKVLTREQLMDNAEIFESFDRSVDVQISNLRKYFKQHQKHHQFIKTKHGAGYYFDADVIKVR